MHSASPLKIITIEQSSAATTLKNPAQQVKFPLSADDRLLIAGMKDKLYRLEGVGLAAPQVNQNKRIIIIYIPDDAALLRKNAKSYPMHTLINPSYEIIESDFVYDFEGCYSVASKSGKVPRHAVIRLSYQDENGQHYTSVESGFYARVLQHEIDHLNGILITDRLTPECLQGSIQEMTAARRRELSPEQQILYDQIMAKKEASISKE